MVQSNLKKLHMLKYLPSLRLISTQYLKHKPHLDLVAECSASKCSFKPCMSVWIRAQTGHDNKLMPGWLTLKWFFNKAKVLILLTCNKTWTNRAVSNDAADLWPSKNFCRKRRNASDAYYRVLNGNVRARSYRFRIVIYKRDTSNSRPS
uniref:Uncharacterized protein n=1 Tax=Romanomermis culicivorax TaxID=13658 RepID=A0A915L3G3_ROMCU